MEHWWTHRKKKWAFGDK